MTVSVAGMNGKRRKPMTRLNIRMRTFWHVRCRIWYFRWLYWQIRISKEGFITILGIIFIAGIGLGMWWRHVQVNPIHQRDLLIKDQAIELLQIRNADLRAALWAMEANKAIARNRGRR